MVIDCGTMQSNGCRERVNSILALGISRKNMRVELSGRVLVRVPRRKQRLAGSRLPLAEPAAYKTATHGFAKDSAGAHTHHAPALTPGGCLLLVAMPDARLLYTGIASLFACMAGGAPRRLLY